MKTIYLKYYKSRNFFLLKKTIMDFSIIKILHIHQAQTNKLIAKSCHNATNENTVNMLNNYDLLPPINVYI